MLQHPIHVTLCEEGNLCNRPFCLLDHIWEARRGVLDVRAVGGTFPSTSSW